MSLSGLKYISSKYSLSISFQTSTSKDRASLTLYSYEVEFSKPLHNKPIPEGTVKVFFSIIETGGGQWIVEFFFENESLKHKLDSTMRTNMFEKWIDRVLENKLKIKSELHLGTEFEYTRTVDEKGKIVDPFVPSFDIKKVSDLGKEMRKS